MATSSNGSKRLYKYVSIHIEWKIYFETYYRYEVDKVKTFFYNFHRSHPNLRFVISKVFDDTTHILLDADGYATVKKELESRTGRTLPEISYISSHQFKGSVSTRTFSSHGKYMDCLNDLKRENEKIYKKRRDDAETESQNLKRFLRSQSNATFLAFDTEMYEHDRETLLEVGFVEFTLKDGNTPKFSHYIITDNEHIKNGDNVPDNRNRFRFGISQRMSLFEAAAQFRRHIDDADALVVHGGREDTRLLAEQGIRTQNKTMFDTQMIALALLPAGPNYWGLKKIMGELDISYDESILHNGGNDAAYTMKVFCALARELTR